MSDTQKLTYISVAKSARKLGLISDGDKIVAAISGGCDSSALLHILMKLKEPMKLDILCAHVNHNLRGEESDRDEKFVRETCERYGVPLRVLSADVDKYAEENHLSTEEAGRELRYEFFERCCDELGEGALVATAHTLSDSAETFLFNVARGTSIDGICGIPPKRDNVIRPLIEFTRKDTETYCAENKVPYVTDSTNLGDDYTRNKIRHRAVPVLKEINPSFEYSLLGIENDLYEVRSLLDSLGNAALEKAKTPKGYNADILGNEPAAVQKRIAAMLLEEFGFAVNRERVLSVVDGFASEDFKTELSKDAYLVKQDGMIFREDKATPLPEIPETDFSEGSFDFPGKNAETKILSPEKFKNLHIVNQYALKDAFDYDKIRGKAIFRSRKTGDKADIHGGTKTLKKLFIEEKIPFEKRNSVIVIADDDGVLWVEGLGAAKRARISENTEKIAAIKISFKNNEISEDSAK